MTYPNLTLDPLKARLSKWQELLYPNQAALALDRGIPKEMLSLAKVKNPSLFSTSKTQINWTKLQPYLSKHYDELKKELDDAKAEKERPDALDLKREKLEFEKLREEVIKLRHANRAKDADFISRKLVAATLRQVINAFSGELVRIYENEQPIKTQNLPPEKIREINKAFNTRLLNKFATPLNEWETASDMETGAEDAGT